MRRQREGKLSRKKARYHIGNKEDREILSTDSKTQSITFRLTERKTVHPFDF